MTKKLPRSPNVLTVPEVARILDVSPMTVYRLCASGELTAHRFGRSIRVYKIDLDEYLRLAREWAS